MGTDNEQQQKVEIEPEIMVEVLYEQVSGLTQENIQLGAYVRQLKKTVRALQERDRDSGPERAV